MKRYWKIISICLVTLLVIGTFYIQSSFATNDHVNIEIEKINGNENEVKNLILSGWYQVGGSHQYLEITNEETGNYNNLSFLQKLKELSVPSNFKGLVDRHKNFMRGKSLYVNHFFEDENVLAYADIKADNLYEQPMKGLAFTIEVMDRQSKEVTSIELDVPERNKYSYMYVEHVQVINDELKIITQGYGMDGTTKLLVYTIDLKEQKLVNEDMIASSPSVVNGWSNLRVIDHVDSFQGKKHFLIQITAYEEEKVQKHGEPDAADNTFILYDIENNESKQIDPPDHLQSFVGETSAILDTTIYMPSQSANGLVVHMYDIENEEWGEKLTVALGDTKENNALYIKMMNGKMISIYATNDGQNLLISDLQTGESLYKGRLHVKKQGESLKDYHLDIHQVEYQDKH